jgi:hypothetical protein
VSGRRRPARLGPYIVARRADAELHGAVGEEDSVAGTDVRAQPSVRDRRSRRVSHGRSVVGLSEDEGTAGLELDLGRIELAEPDLGSRQVRHDRHRVLGRGGRASDGRSGLLS